MINDLTRALWLIATLDPEVWGTLAFSVQVSVVSTAIASTIGITTGIFLGMKQFKGKTFVVNFTNSMMGFPPVVAGVIIFMLLSRNGPFGAYGLLYTPAAIIIAQTLLNTPIVTGITIAAISRHHNRVSETTVALGGTRWDVYENILSECKVPITGGIIVAFGQAISEVGASIIVGGNIRHYTRTMTTAIVQQASMGDASMALALGIILIGASFALVLVLTTIQMRARTG